MKDSLDHKIDALLASRPVRAPADFTDRVLAAAAEAEAAAAKARLRRRILAFAAPLAAAAAIAVALPPSRPEAPAAPAATAANGEPLAEELILLEDGLSGLAEFDRLETDGLLDTLEALYLDIES